MPVIISNTAPNVKSIVVSTAPGASVGVGVWDIVGVRVIKKVRVGEGVKIRLDGVGDNWRVGVSAPNVVGVGVFEGVGA